MRWSFTIPGQPLSWNAAYRIGSRNRQGSRGQVRFGADGEPATYRKMIKTDDAVAFTNDVAMLARNARPSGWKPEGLIIIEYRLYLGRSLDADNTMKLIDDGIAEGLGVDDKWFLPRAMWIEWGLRPSLRRSEITVADFE